MMEIAKNVVPISVDPEGLLSKLMDTAPDPILTLDQAGKIKLASSMALKLFGYARSEMIGLHFESLVQNAPDQSISDISSINNLTSLKLFKKNGSSFAAEVSFASLNTPDGKFVTVFIRDVSPRKKLELELKIALSELRDTNNKLRRLSEVDHLTEALNRRGLEQILKRESERMSRDGTSMSVALLDLDNLKAINEKFGHLAGDTVLKEIAQRSMRALRSTDYFARIGGDEFMILFPSTDSHEAALVTERVRKAVSETEILPDTISTVSGGVVQLPMRLHTLEEILPLLRNALKKSKAEGKNCVCIGTNNDSSRSVRTYSPSELNCVLEQGLSANCDTICSLDERVVRGVEFQVRGPRDLLHTPIEILQAAAEMNMLTHTDLVCAQTCAKEAERRKDHLPLHMNILPSTLESVPTERLIEILSAVMKNRLVCLELSVLRINSEPGYLIDPCRELKEQGIQIALDDVCYGRSSLEALIVLEPTFVKLDGHFVSGVNKDIRRQNAVKRLLKMSRVVGAEVIAQGIETNEECEVLKELGVSLGQGFLFGSA
ncbi:MAG: diguanylate cyclase [Cyanobacteria bacterium TGS_CYA1]|nr:diguanylate cyclase [Cyanobacteria bacterium TGS_CYA1]